MTYLEIDLRDNDCTAILQFALHRLWGYVNRNNGHLQQNRLLPDMFRWLHSNGLLEKIISVLFFLECEASSIEFATRGLDTEKINWKHHTVDDPDSWKNWRESYFGQSLNVRIVKRKRPRIKWSNGEIVWLELETGKSGIV